MGRKGREKRYKEAKGQLPDQCVVMPKLTCSQVSPPECRACSTTLSRPWACLTCPFVGCLSLYPSSSSRKSSNCAVKHMSDSNGDCKFGESAFLFDGKIADGEH
jgi:hypothetical protein